MKLTHNVPANTLRLIRVCIKDEAFTVRVLYCCDKLLGVSV
jgi:hypothetical protein